MVVWQRGVMVDGGAVPCPAPLMGWMGGRRSQRAAHPSVMVRCQSLPTASANPPLPWHRACGFGSPLPTPGPCRSPSVLPLAAGVILRFGSAFPCRRCPVNLCLHKPAPGTAESAARAAPGAGPNLCPGLSSATRVPGLVVGEETWLGPC